MRNLEDVYKELQGLAPPFHGAPEALPAAVLVLWRRHAESFEVYLVRRALTMRFLPGFWTFPGGKVDSEDLGAREAACRELAEETGVVLACDSLSVGGRWCTPEFSPLRFDTQYFLAELPEGQEADACVSRGELIDGAWWSPRDALKAFAEGRLLMPTPIVRLVEALEPGIEGATDRALRAAEAEASAPRLWEVAGGVAVSPLRTPTLPPATHTNCYVIGTGELVVIDPATYEASERHAICAALDARIAIGQEIMEIWLTHHHGDHIGSAEYLSERYGVPICAHERSAVLLENRCRVDQHLRDGERRVLRGPLERELVCLFTPGHAPGHLCFFEEHTRALVAGDMVASEGTILIDPSEGDMAAYLQSLERMRTLGARTILPAHGMPLSDPDTVLDRYRAHRLMREDRVLQALGSEPLSARQLVKVVYADTPLALHGLAERSLLSHLLKLQAEQRASVASGGWFAT